MQILLETERLALRRFTPTDADKLFELDSDPEVMRFLTGGTPTPREQIDREILPRFLRSHDLPPGYGFLAAIGKSGGDFLGWFGFVPREGGSPGEMELGYRLRRAVWGCGYATEGARALIRAGFSEPGVRRVRATTYEYNLASRRVMEKAGLRLVRRYRLTTADLLAVGTFQGASQELWDGDDLEYALDKTEWDAAGIGQGR